MPATFGTSSPKAPASQQPHLASCFSPFLQPCQKQAGSLHLQAGLLQAPIRTGTRRDTAVVTMKRLVLLRAYTMQVQAAVHSCSEPADEAQQPALSAEAQAAALVQQYKDWAAKHGGSPPPATADAWQQQKQQQRTPSAGRPRQPPVGVARVCCWACDLEARNQPFVRCVTCSSCAKIKPIQTHF